MNIVRFLKSPEKAISEAGRLEWHWTKREAVAGALATVAFVSAGVLQASEGSPDESVDLAPVDQVVEVTE